MQPSKRVFSITFLPVFLTGAAFAQEATKQCKNKSLVHAEGTRLVKTTRQLVHSR
jgi:hypothetical protein